MTHVAFTIPGVPQQQGSKRHVGNGVSIEANKNLKPWRAVAMSAALDARPHAALDGVPLFTGPLRVFAYFYFPRPKSHYGTGKNAGVLKTNAPHWHSSAPDLDKLLRAVGDVLTQADLIRDDRLIASWIGLKRYGTPRVDLNIQDIEAAS